MTAQPSPETGVITYGGPGTTPHRHLNVVIIQEDIPGLGILQDLLSAALPDYTVKVRAFSSMDEAVEHMRHDEDITDMVFSEFTAGSHDGESVVNYFRDLLELYKPTVLVSGDIDEDFAITLIENGISDVLHKPINIDRHRFRNLVLYTLGRYKYLKNQVIDLKIDPEAFTKFKEFFETNTCYS